MGKGGIGGKIFGRALALVAGTAILFSAAPAQAQFSKSYTFLKAVRDGDGSKVNEALNEPGSTLINTKDYTTGEAALHIVVKRRDINYMRFLLAKGADANIRDRDGNTPLILATQISLSEAITPLINYRAGVNIANNRGETPLITAVQARDIASARLLLTAGADPLITDRVAGLSAKDYAAQDRRSTLISKAIEEHLKTSKPAAAISGPRL